MQGKEPLETESNEKVQEAIGHGFVTRGAVTYFHLRPRGQSWLEGGLRHLSNALEGVFYGCGMDNLEKWKRILIKGASTFSSHLGLASTISQQSSTRIQATIEPLITQVERQRPFIKDRLDSTTSKWHSDYAKLTDKRIHQQFRSMTPLVQQHHYMVPCSLSLSLSLSLFRPWNRKLDWG